MTLLVPSPRKSNTAGHGLVMGPTRCVSQSVVMVHYNIGDKKSHTAWGGLGPRRMKSLCST